MENFFMNDVGSGLNCAIRRDSSFQFMIDMGAMDGKMINIGNSKPYVTDTFMLSHYHLDHYNGIGKHKAKFALKNVYLPQIPTICDPTTNEEICSKFVTRLLSFAIYTERKTILEYILKLLYSSSTKKFKVKFVSKGDTFVYGERGYEVIWPPKQIEENDAIKDVRAAIDAYEKLAQENPLLRQTEIISIEIRNLLIRLGEIDQFQVEREELFEHAIYDIEHRWRRIIPEFYEFSKEENPLDNKQLIKETNDKLRKAANHLSIAFRQEDNILFLGDLEPKELEIICEELDADKQTHYDILIAPHHGTHWDKKMKQLKCDYALASIGHSLVHNIKQEELSTISKCFLRTDCYGAINIQKKNILS